MNHVFGNTVKSQFDAIGHTIPNFCDISYQQVAENQNV